MKAIKQEIYYAICQFYEPFTMGGSVWHFVRFKVDGEKVKLTKKFKGFVYQCDLTQEYRVHELKSGGLLGHGTTVETAIKQANKNIKITPDLADQIAKLGDSSNFRTVPTKDALRRIANNKESSQI